MSNLIKPFHFFDNGSAKREKENFQGFFFNKIDMRKRDLPISFYRSDFRGAKFQDVTFSKNNFSNSDFMDSSVTSATFDTCQFKFAEIYNSYFEKTSFTNSVFSATSLVKLVFENSSIKDSKFDANTFRECKFINCKITDSIFEKNSMDDIEFEKTSFKNIDLSNMTAINLFFNNCKFENVIIDADYLGSYFFKGRFFDNLKLKYRGKLFDLNMSQSDLLNNLFKIFMERGRYYEAINIAIQKKILEKATNSIFHLLEASVNHLLKEKSQLKRSYQFDKIFRLLEYYLNTGYISITDYFRTVGYLESLDLDGFEFFEQIDFTEKVNRLKTILEKMDLTLEFIDSSGVKEKILLEITIDEKDKKKFENYFKICMLDIGKSLSIEGIPYEIISGRKGSWIYQIVAYPAAGLLFLKVLLSSIKLVRQTLHESLHLAIDYRMNVKVLDMTKKLKGKDQLARMKDIKEYQIMSKQSLSKSSEVKVDEAVKLLPLIKAAIVYPNALPKGDN